ncbi:MAG: DUF2490 domain-containing protein [Bacteroidia bacterium]
MQIIYTYLILTLLFFSGASLKSQTVYDAQYLASHPRIYTQRHSFWFEGNVNFDLSKSKRWQFQMDYQYRRCSDPSYIAGGQTNNIFKDPFQQVFRPWLHYWIKPGAVRFSLSPLGYWISWVNGDEAKIYAPTQGNSGKYGAVVFPEFRVTPQITTVQKFGRIEYFNRFRYEFRFVGQRTLSNENASDFGKGDNFSPNTPGDPLNDSTGISKSQRLRWQVRLQVPLTKDSRKNQIYINAWNEVFLSFGKYVGTSKILNQNRTVLMLGYKVQGKIPVKIEVGVTEQVLFAYNIKTPPTQPSTVNYNKQNVELNTALQVYLIFDSFQNLFKKKDKPIEAIK